MDEADWVRLAALADRADDPGHFTAIRGFEWTTGTLGHVNVWFSQRWTDAWSTASLVTPRGGTQISALVPGAPAELTELFEGLPDTAEMDLFYEWLTSPPDRALLEGGNDGLAGFNHPNSQWGNFKDFQYHPAAADRMVSCEAMNYDQDFFFKGVDEGKGWPLARILDAGWRVGFLGVSDEHGEAYGGAGLARGGLWVTELSRDGVREALASRRMFATFEHGLRLDMAVDGVPMGATRAVTDAGHVEVALDLDAGPASHGRELLVQVVRPGTGGEPLLAHEQAVTIVPDRIVTFPVDVDGGEGDWLFLRVVDPDRSAAPGAIGGWDAAGGALAYSSPVWFAPDGAPGTDLEVAASPGTSREVGPAAVDRPHLPATGSGAVLAGAAALGLARILRRRG